MARTQRVSIDNLGGGINSDMRDHEINPSESPDNLRNIRTDGNSKKPRKGFSTTGSDLGSTPIRGIFGFDRDSSSDDTLLVSWNQDIYEFDVNTSTWGINIETTQTVDSLANFTKYKDWAFVFNGTDEIGRVSTQNVTFANITGTGIAFVDSNPDTITDTGNGFVTAGFVNGDKIVVSGSASNDGTYTIATVVAGTITLDAGDSLTAEGTGATVTIVKQLQASDTSSKLAANWTLSTGTYDVVFSNGDERVVTLTNGATTATWTTGLTTTATQAATTVGYDEPATKPDSISQSSDFTPLFGDLYLNSMITGGVPTAPNTFFISKPATSASPSDIYDFSGAVSGGGADEILAKNRATAVKELSGFAVLFTIKGALLMKGFKDYNSTAVPNVEPIKGADGCVNQKSAVVVGNDCFYLTPNKEIRSVRKAFAETVTAEIANISRKINPTLQALIDDSFAADSNGYYDRKNQLVKFHVREVGSSFPNICITGYLNEADEEGNPKWLIDDGKAFGDGTFWENKSITSSAVRGRLYEDETGLADEDNAPIPTVWDTKNFNGNAPTIRKRYRNINVYGFIAATTALTIKVFVDDDEKSSVTVDSNDVGSAELGGIATEPVGEYSVGDDDVIGEAQELLEFVKRIPIRVTGKKLKLRFETDQINTDYIISDIDYDAIILGKQNVPIGEKL